MKKTTMKKTIAAVMLATMGITSYAQNGLECIEVERYYVTDATDSVESDNYTTNIGDLNVGAVTYRVWADMLPGYKFQAIYGVTGHFLNIHTTTDFYNNESRGATSPTYSKSQAQHEAIMIDTWFAVGGAANNAMAVQKSEDDGIANANFPDNMLLNTVGYPIALTTQDGFYSGVGSPSSTTFVGFTTLELEPFDYESHFGNDMHTDNASVACLVGATGPTASNKVLIGQFTTTGIFTFELNVQIGTPTGGAENYVANSPTGAEIMLSCLTFNSLTSTTVGIPVEETKTESIGVYPNPAKDNINIEIHSSSKAKNVSYKIMNVLGEVVLQSEITNPKSEINVSELAKGLYFVEITTDGKKVVKKIVKE